MRKGHNTVFFVASHLSNIFDTASKMDAFESESENTVIVKEIVVRGKRIMQLLIDEIKTNLCSGDKFALQ